MRYLLISILLYSSAVLAKSEYKTRLNIDSFAYNSYCSMKKYLSYSELETAQIKLSQAEEQFNESMAIKFNVSDNQTWNKIAGKIIPFSAMAFQEISVAHFGSLKQNIDYSNSIFAYLLYVGHEDERLAASYPEMLESLSLQDYINDPKLKKKIDEYVLSDNIKISYMNESFYITGFF